MANISLEESRQANVEAIVAAVQVNPGEANPSPSNTSLEQSMDNIATSQEEPALEEPTQEEPAQVEPPQEEPADVEGGVATMQNGTGRARHEVLHCLDLLC